MKYYLAIIVILIFYNISFSQNYLDSNPIWTEYTISCGGGNPYCTSEEYTIKLEADTTINNKVYYKTKRQGITTTWDWNVDTLVSENVINDYLYPLREDQGRFYIFRSFQNVEQLLHNFDLEVGDTAISSSSFCPKPQIVMEIDTIYFGTQMRKKFIFTPHLSWAASPLYEGIGTSRGLFVKPCSGVIGVESGSILQCYTTNDESLQIDTSGLCETTIPVSTHNLVVNENNVYPNPFDEKIIIESKFKEVNNIEIKLYNLHGNLIKSSSMPSDGSMVNISTKGLNSGIYILIISSNNEIYTTKMVKL